jgi:hypothetical protein
LNAAGCRRRRRRGRGPAGSNGGAFDTASGYQALGLNTTGFFNSSGQLGVLASSERYKTAISPNGERSDELRVLRPVTFHLKSDPPGALQFGLIAEEVERIYPDL